MWTSGIEAVGESSLCIVDTPSEIWWFDSIFLNEPLYSRLCMAAFPVALSCSKERLRFFHSFTYF